MKQLKKLDKTARSFEANGKIYYVETELSIERFHEYQIYEKEAGFGLSFKSMVETIRDAYTDLNQMKAADASVKLHDLLAGITKPAEKEHVLLKICALFMKLNLIPILWPASPTAVPLTTNSATLPGCFWSKTTPLRSNAS